MKTLKVNKKRDIIKTFCFFHNEFLSLQFQNYVKDLLNWMHFKGGIYKEQHMGIIYGTPADGFSKLWILWWTAKLEVSNFFQFFNIFSVTIFCFHYGSLLLLLSLCSPACPETM